MGIDRLQGEYPLRDLPDFLASNRRPSHTLRGSGADNRCVPKCELERLLSPHAIHLSPRTRPPRGCVYSGDLPTSFLRVWFHSTLHCIIGKSLGKHCLLPMPTAERAANHGMDAEPPTAPFEVDDRTRRPGHRHRFCARLCGPVPK